MLNFLSIVAAEPTFDDISTMCEPVAFENAWAYKRHYIEQSVVLARAHANIPPLTDEQKALQKQYSKITNANKAFLLHNNLDTESAQKIINHLVATLSQLSSLMPTDAELLQLTMYTCWSGLGMAYYLLNQESRALPFLRMALGFPGCCAREKAALDVEGHYTLVLVKRILALRLTQFYPYALKALEKTCNSPREITRASHLRNFVDVYLAMNDFKNAQKYFLQFKDAVVTSKNPRLRATQGDVVQQNIKIVTQYIDHCFPELHGFVIKQEDPFALNGERILKAKLDLVDFEINNIFSLVQFFKEIECYAVEKATKIECLTRVYILYMILYTASYDGDYLKVLKETLDKINALKGLPVEEPAAPKQIHAIPEIVEIAEISFDIIEKYLDDHFPELRSVKIHPNTCFTINIHELLNAKIELEAHSITDVDSLVKYFEKICSMPVKADVKTKAAGRCALIYLGLFTEKKTSYYLYKTWQYMCFISQCVMKEQK